jgi:hypothetical protein
MYLSIAFQSAMATPRVPKHEITLTLGEGTLFVNEQVASSPWNSPAFLACPHRLRRL